MKTQKEQDPLYFARELVALSQLEEDQQKEVLENAFDRACDLISGMQNATVVKPYTGESPASIEIATRSILVFYGIPSELII